MKHRRHSPSSAPIWIALAVLTLAFTWSAFWTAGVTPDFEFSALALGALAIALAIRSQAPPLDRALFWPAVILCGWIAFQLVPVPGFVVGLISPARAQFAIEGTSWMPLSVAPAETWREMLRVFAAVGVFVAMREIAWRFGEERAPWLLALPLVGVSVLEAILGLLQHAAAPLVSASGTYGNRNHFAGLLEMALPFPVMFGIVHIRRRSRWESPLRPVLIGCAGFAAAAMMLSGVIFSYSRMGFLASLVGLTVCFGVSFGGTRRLGRVRRGFALALALLLVLFVFLPPDQLITRLAKLSPDEDLSADGRAELFRETIPLVSAFPLTGAGLGGYESAFSAFKRSAPMNTDNYAHNDYLQYAAELGIPVLVCVLIGVGSILKRSFVAARSHASEQGRTLGLASLASMVSMLLHSAVDFNSYIPANAVAFACVAAIAVSLEFSSRAPLHSPHRVIEARMIPVSA